MGIRFGELIHPAKLQQRLELLVASKPHLKELVDLAAMRAKLTEVASRLAPYVQPTEPTLWSALARQETVLLEGAQSALLDVDFGTYPYVTSHHPTSAGALVGSGIPPFEVSEVVGVTKAYATRVGAGPFPTEVEGDLGAYLQREGGERGATTGRVRQVGWLDLVLLRYVTKLNGFTSLALTKVDVLGGLDDVPVAVQYVTPDGRTLTDYPPSDAEELAHVTPVYEKLPAWPKFNERLTARLREEGASALPSPLKRFVEYLRSRDGRSRRVGQLRTPGEETVWLGKSHGGPSAGAVTAWAQ